MPGVLSACQYGVGAGASRLVSGDLPPHRLLESDLADFLGLPSALLFPTGYQTNIGVLTTLAAGAFVSCTYDVTHTDAGSYQMVVRAFCPSFAMRDCVTGAKPLCSKRSVCGPRLPGERPSG